MTQVKLISALLRGTLALSLLVWSGAAFAQADREFLTEAARGLQERIDASMIGHIRNENPQIDGLSEDLVRDHREALDEIERLAGAEGFSLPDTLLRPEAQDEIARLSERRPQPLDREYLEFIGVSLARDLQLLEERLTGGGLEDETASWMRRRVVSLRRLQDRVNELRTEVLPAAPINEPS